MNYRSIISLIGYSALIVLTLIISHPKEKKHEFNIVKFIARVSIFGALSSILYVVPIFRFKLPFFPSFLDIHFDEIPAFICGFAYGPLAAFTVLAIKTIIKLPMSTSFTVGEFSDLVMSTVYIVPACLIYVKNRNLKGVFAGLIVSSILQIMTAILLNIYVTIPVYSLLLNLSESDLLYLMRLAIPSIKDVGWSYGLLAVLPFNLLKDLLVFLFTFIIYRKIHIFLRFEGRKGIKKAD